MNLEASQLAILVLLGWPSEAFSMSASIGCRAAVAQLTAFALPVMRLPPSVVRQHPVLSYLLLGGRCRKCRAGISIRYPLVELITMALFVIHGEVFGWSALLVPRLVFACAMVVLFAIDLEHQLLPNVITLPGIVVGLIASAVLPPGIVDALIGVLIGGGVLWLIGEAYFRYSGHEGMGGGDVKMLAMIGAFLGWKLVLVTLVLSSIAGSLIGLAVIAFRKGGMKYALPYGTFLALGALVASLAGDAIVNWYVGLY